MPCVGSRFKPVPNETIVLAGQSYMVQPHPRAPGSTFSAEGRRAVVYGLRGSGDQIFALKVFKKAFRDPVLLESAALLGQFASFPGMMAANRTVVHAQDPAAVDCPDLAYATLMRWIPGSTWNDLLMDAERGRQNYPLDVGLHLCGRFLGVMEALEKAGAAHTDIAPGNVSVSVKSIDVQLLDLEDLYVPGIRPPQVRNTGTAGYRHPSANEGQTTWCAEGDRFAVAVMAAEMLILTNAILGRHASDNGYFDGDRTTAVGAQRFEAAYPFLQSVAPGFAELFYAAWLSPALERCPPASALREALAKAPAPPPPIPGVKWEAFPPPIPPQTKAATAAQGSSSSFWVQQPPNVPPQLPNFMQATVTPPPAQKTIVGWVLLAVVIIFALIGFAVYQSVQEEQRVAAARAESERQSAIEAQRVEEQKAAEEARVKAAEEARLKAAAPSATIARVWIDHNVFEGSEKGMRVHLSFTVNNLNGSQCQALLLYFFDDGTPEGSPIVNGKARCWLTGTEQLCGVTAFTPRFPQAEFSDLQIFVPSNDLFSVSGDHSKFKVKAQIQQVGGARLAVTDWFLFETQQTP